MDESDVPEILHRYMTWVKQYIRDAQHSEKIECKPILPQHAPHWCEEYLN